MRSEIKEVRTDLLGGRHQQRAILRGYSHAGYDGGRTCDANACAGGKGMADMHDVGVERRREMVQKHCVWLNANRKDERARN